MAYLANFKDAQDSQAQLGGNMANTGATLNAGADFGGAPAPTTGAVPTPAASTVTNEQKQGVGDFTNLQDYLKANEKASDIMATNVAGKVNEKINTATSAGESIYNAPTSSTSSSVTYDTPTYNATYNSPALDGFDINGMHVSSQDVKSFYAGGGDENAILSQYSITDPAQRQSIIQQARVINQAPVINQTGFSSGSNFYTPEQVRDYVQSNQNNPAEIAKQANAAGLDVNQIQQVLAMGGVNVSATDIANYGASQGYNFNPALHQVITSTPPIPTNIDYSAKAQQQPGGLWVGGAYIAPTEIKDFYASGGDDNQWLQQHGVTDLWEIHDLANKARDIGRPQGLTGEESLLRYFREYQKYNPNGAHANDFEGWKRDQDPVRYTAMVAGTYTGVSTSGQDFGMDGIYGPGSAYYGQAGYGSGLGPRGMGSQGGDWGQYGVSSGSTQMLTPDQQQAVMAAASRGEALPVFDRTPVSQSSTGSSKAISAQGVNQGGRTIRNTTTNTAGSWDPTLSQKKLQLIAEAQDKAKLLGTEGGRTELLNQLLNTDEAGNRTTQGGLNLDEFIMGQSQNQSIPGAAKNAKDLNAVYERIIAELNRPHALGTAGSSTSTQYIPGVATTAGTGSASTGPGTSTGNTTTTATGTGGTPPTWADIYNQWAPQYKQQYGDTINRPWNADADARWQKTALDNAYLEALARYNAANGTNVQPDQSKLGVNAQPNAYGQTSNPSMTSNGARYDGAGDGTAGMSGETGSLGDLGSALGIGPGNGNIGGVIGGVLGGPIGGMIGNAIGDAIGLGESSGIGIGDGPGVGVGAAEGGTGVGGSAGIGSGTGLGGADAGASADGGSDGVGGGGDGVFANGGFVKGPGTAKSDSIDAKLSNGEYVIPAEIVKRYGKDFFDHLLGVNSPGVQRSNK